MGNSTASLVPKISLRINGGAGNFSLLAIDTRPNYIDTTPMPATSAKWKYRAIYSNDAQRTG